MKVRMELLVRPTCNADRDRAVLSEVAEEFGLELAIVDLWQIDDDELDNLPEYISNLVRPARQGKAGLLDHGWLFINGIPFKADWHNDEQLETLRLQLKSLVKSENSA